MKISNLRLGHATNSSSCHSIVISGTSTFEPENYDPGQYGSENFLLETHEEKKQYLAQVLAGGIRLQHKIDDDDDMSMYIPIINKCLGGDYYIKGGYIDHQSEWKVPIRHSGEIDYEFFSEFAEEFAKDKDVSIQGGYDGGIGGGGEYHEEWNRKLGAFVISDSSVYTRKDEDWWTVFDSDSGNKIRLSFKNNPVPYKPVRPELIDVKITDKCNKNCDYCYQDSKKNGRHADYKDVCKIIDFAANNSVFEIALGGGDPVLHPDWLDILCYGRKKNISVSFSTKSLDWIKLKDDKFLKKFGENCRAYGFSISSVDDIKKIIDKHRKFSEILSHKIHRRPNTNLILQYIPELYGLEQLEDILKYLINYSVDKIYYGFSITLLLLGFKETGRGQNKKWKKCLGWSFVVRRVIDKLKHDHYVPNIAVDTLFASRYPDDLKGIDERMYYLHEGVFSMYIDVVNKCVAKSSFSPEKIPYNSIKNILPTFIEWNSHTKSNGGKMKDGTISGVSGRRRVK